MITIETLGMQKLEAHYLVLDYNESLANRGCFA